MGLVEEVIRTLCDLAESGDFVPRFAITDTYS